MLGRSDSARKRPFRKLLFSLNSKVRVHPSRWLVTGAGLLVSVASAGRASFIEVASYFETMAPENYMQVRPIVLKPCAAVLASQHATIYLIRVSRCYNILLQSSRSLCDGYRWTITLFC